MNPTGIGAAFVAAVYGFAALWAVQHRDLPGTRAYVGVLCLLGVIAGTTAGGVFEVLGDVTVGRLFVICWLMASTLWAIFAVEYTGRGPVLTRFRIGGLLVFALLTSGLSIGAQLYDVSSEIASLVLIPLQLTVLSLAVFGVIVVARAGVTYADLPLRRSLSLTAGGTTLTLLYVLGIVIDTVGIDPAFEAGTLILAAGAASFLLGQFRYGVFESDPTTGYLAREKVLDEMSACVVLVDRENQLLDVNDATVETFDLERRQAIGRPIASVIGLSRERPQDSPVTLETARGQREFTVRSTSLVRAEDRVGTIYVLRDVTEQRTHEQRLAVLNRVLRHNLRNDLDAIRAFTETLGSDDEGASDPDQLVRRIERTAREIQETGTGVARAERILSGSGPEREHANVGDLARRVADTVAAASPEASIDVTGSDPVLYVDPRVLETVLEELVENAIQHNDRADPTVVIGITEVDDGVEVSVRDNGPGIPDHDRSVLLDGEETPLHHGRGLGLWLVYWGIKRLGGELSFDVEEAGGSVVSISLPAFDTAD